MPLPRHAALGATVLLGLSLSACGGPPDDASVADFCAAIDDTSWAAGLDESSSGEDVVDALGEWGDQLEETGTPDGIPGDAREGFEITIDTLHDLDADDFDGADDVGDVTGDLSEDEQDKVDALNAYKTEKCAG